MEQTLGPPRSRQHVFLSYNRADTDVADDLLKKLARARISVWMDRHNLQLGEVWTPEVENAIGTAAGVILLASPASRRSQWVQREVQLARKREVAVIPVVVSGTPDEVLPPELRDLHYCDLRGQTISDNAVRPLIQRVFDLLDPIIHTAEELQQDLQVPAMVAEHTFLGTRALQPAEMSATYFDEPILLPAALEVARIRHLETALGAATARGETVDNNLSYSLHGLSVRRPQDGEGARHHIYSLVVRPTDFFHFMFPNLVLDMEIDLAGRQTTARNELGLRHDRIRIENLSDFPCHFRIGTGAVVITSDAQVVVSIRSRHQFIVGGAHFHLSTAEGMLRPVDVNDGGPSPFSTCERALSDELGLRAGEHYQLVDDMRCIAIAMDTLRAQPYFVFFIRTAAVSFETIRRQWLVDAPDRHENRDIVGLPWTPQNARRLAAGRLTYGDKEIEAASNHARFGYTVAALHTFGTDAVGESRQDDSKHGDESGVVRGK